MSRLFVVRCGEIRRGVELILDAGRNRLVDSARI
jgi:hypothetical protein